MPRLVGTRGRQRHSCQVLATPCLLSFAGNFLRATVTQPKLAATDPPRLSRAGSASSEVMRNSGGYFLPALCPGGWFDGRGRAPA